MPEQANGKRKNLEEGLGSWPPQANDLFKSEDLQHIAEAANLRTTLATDYVNVLALNESGEAMIFERSHGGGGFSSWRVIEGRVADGEDPMTAVRRTLLEETGYQSEHWMYLCSYTITDDRQELGVGHFFCARNARPITAESQLKLTTDRDQRLKWVSQQDLRYALLDGRISILSYAITISMALLTVLE
jgi:ADP-ribose pyrophosphatase YjhB (NUDIX family)